MSPWLRGVSLAVLLLSGAGVLVCLQRSDSRAIMPQEQAKRALAEQYREALEAWKKYIQKPEISLSSSPSAYTDNEPYNRLVALGPPALPFLVGSLEEGEFFLNEAMRRITGIDVRSLYPKEKVEGEQDLSKLWVRWWNEKGRAAHSGGR